MHPEVWAVAAIGSWGEYPNNCNRDLKRFLGDVEVLPAPFVIKVPCVDTKSSPNITMYDELAMFLPHLWFASVFRLDEADALLGMSKIAGFWDHVHPADPRLIANGGHPILQVPNFKSAFVPLWLHGDGVEYTEDDSLMVYTCGSVLTATSSMLAMFYLASFVKSVTAVLGKYGVDTWMEVWNILAWSFEAAWLGVHPALDWNDQPFPAGSRCLEHAGQLLCAGLRFVVWNLIGDLEFFANTMGLTHWRAHSLCWACNCSRVILGLDWRINWNGRGWVLYDPAVYHMQTRHGHKFWNVAGVTSWNACQDMLHCLDNHGVNSHLCGSFLHDRVYNNSAGRTPQQELARIWLRLQELHREVDNHDSKLVRLQLSMLCNPAKPFVAYATLHAKGAEVRHLVPILAKFAAEENDGSPVAQHQLCALRCMSQFYRLCDTSPMFPSAQAATTALSLMDTALAVIATQ